VPFVFDVNAMIHSDDAPALEPALHRRFLQNQVNKVTHRKESFRLKIQDIRNVIDQLEHEVRWTMAAEARDYRETLAMERQMQEDPEFRKRWTALESAYESRLPFDDEGEETVQEHDDVALTAEPIQDDAVLSGLKRSRTCLRLDERPRFSFIFGRRQYRLPRY
jgi:hypothetical protein